MSAPLEDVLVKQYTKSSAAKPSRSIPKTAPTLDDVHGNGTGKVLLEWHYEEGDLDMLEAGQDYKGLLDMPVKLIES